MGTEFADSLSPRMAPQQAIDAMEAEIATIRARKNDSSRPRQRAD